MYIFLLCLLSLFISIEAYRSFFPWKDKPCVFPAAGLACGERGVNHWDWGWPVWPGRRATERSVLLVVRAGCHGILPVPLPLIGFCGACVFRGFKPGLISEAVAFNGPQKNNLCLQHVCSMALMPSEGCRNSAGLTHETTDWRACQNHNVPAHALCLKYSNISYSIWEVSITLQVTFCTWKFE